MLVRWRFFHILQVFNFSTSIWVLNLPSDTIHVEAKAKVPVQVQQPMLGISARHDPNPTHCAVGTGDAQGRCARQTSHFFFGAKDGLQLDTWLWHDYGMIMSWFININQYVHHPWPLGPQILYCSCAWERPKGFIFEVAQTPAEILHFGTRRPWKAGGWMLQSWNDPTGDLEHVFLWKVKKNKTHQKSTCDSASSNHSLIPLSPWILPFMCPHMCPLDSLIVLAQPAFFLKGDWVSAIS